MNSKIPPCHGNSTTDYCRITVLGIRDYSKIFVTGRDGWECLALPIPSGTIPGIGKTCSLQAIIPEELRPYVANLKGAGKNSRPEKITR